MPGGKDKKSVRQCAICKKVGHNRSTCPERFLTSQNKTETPLPPASNAPQPAATKQSLTLFVHHTTKEPADSEHRLDLKQESASPWHQVESSAPSEPKNPTFYFHHNQPPFAIAPNQMAGEEAALKTESEPLEPPRETTPVHFVVKNRTVFEKMRDAFGRMPHKLKKPSAKKNKKALAPIISPATEPAPAPAPESSYKTTKTSAPTVHRNVRRTVLIGALCVIAAAGLANCYWYVKDLASFVSTVTGSAATGVSSLMSIRDSIDSRDWASAIAQNNAARTDLSRALSKIQTEHQALQTAILSIPVVGRVVRDRERLLIAANQVAVGNSHLLAALSDTSTTTLGARLVIMARGSEAALGPYSQALETFQSINITSVPAPLRSTFSRARAILSAGATDVSALHDLTTVIPDLFGGEGRRRYLVMFQNPSELRATGGFLGSYAFIEAYNGSLTKFVIPPGGTYDVQGQLSQFVEPPAPLLMTNRRWELQDANWFPDWPVSAKKIDWFYRHSRGVSVDGVIAINSSVLPPLLALLGPVDDHSRGVTFASDTALTDLQTIVESSTEKAGGKPKAVIGDVATVLADRIVNVSDPERILSLVTVLRDALVHKDVQIALFDVNKAAVLNALGWDGALRQTEPGQDYLLVNASNIGGQKSDARMEQQINHEAVVNADGTVDVTVTITRTHTGTSTEPLYGATNVSYVRVYVPLGSKLITARGFSWPDERSFRAPLPNDSKDEDLAALEVASDSDANSGTLVMRSLGKTVFANWMITEPATTTQAVLRYRLPFVVPLATEASFNAFLNKLTGTDPAIAYQLVVERQPGAKSNFSSAVIFPDTYSTLWVNGPGAVAGINGLSVPSTMLISNTVFSLLMHKT